MIAANALTSAANLAVAVALTVALSAFPGPFGCVPPLRSPLPPYWGFNHRAVAAVVACGLSACIAVARPRADSVLDTMALPFDGNDASVVVDLAPASPRASQHRTPPHSALMSNMHDLSGRSRATLRTVSSLQSMASHASSTGGVSSHRSHKPGSHRRGSDGSMKIRQREPMVRTDPWHARSRRDGSEPPSDVAVRLRHADASPVARRSPKLGAADPDACGDKRGYDAGIGGSGATIVDSVQARDKVLRQSSSVDSRAATGDLPLYRSHRPTRVDVGEYSPVVHVPVSTSKPKLVFSASSTGGGDSARSLAGSTPASRGVSAYVVRP